MEKNKENYRILKKYCNQEDFIKYQLKLVKKVDKDIKKQFKIFQRYDYEMIRKKGDICLKK